MPGKYVCPRCTRAFTSMRGLDAHSNRKIQCSTEEKKDNSKLNVEYFVCKGCNATYSHKNSLIRHQKMYCKQIENDRLNSLEKQVEDLVKNPRNVHNINNINNISNNLKVVCIGSSDNLLDMLSEDIGFDRALEFIKDCALSSLNGDCKLLEKIYQTESNESIKYTDNKRTTLEYYDHNQKKITEKGNVLGRLLANSLQSSYLKGINFLVKEKTNKDKKIEDHDIQTWNAHIYLLSDQRYQKTLVSNLKIPGPI